MSAIDAAVFASLRELSSEPEGEDIRFRGTMVFDEALLGPPGRVHGGIHPLVRTLPILARLRGDLGEAPRVRIDAALQKALPVGERVGFDGRYRADGEGFVLETRFLESERLRATATVPSATDLPRGETLVRFRELFARATAEEARCMRILGMPYQITPSTVFLDLRTRDHVDEGAHLAKAMRADGSLGLAALSTQLDAVGASGRGVLMRHPHFTKHITLAFDLEGLAADTPLLVVADRTTVVEDAQSEKVEIRGQHYGTARVEAIVVDAAFERCFGHGFVTVHPVEPARFAGFEEMRKIRQP